MRDPDISAALERAILVNERRRATFVGGFACVTLAYVVLWLPALPNGVSLLLAILAIYELVFLRTLFGHALRTGNAPWLGMRYVNAFLETSVPTLAMLIELRSLGAVNIIGGPGVLVYGVFIALSTLRLDPRLSLFTGAVAAAEFGLLVTRIAPAVVTPETTLVLSSVSTAPKVAFLFFTGMAAAVASGMIRRSVLDLLLAGKARSAVLHLFGQHVSPQVADALLLQGTDEATRSRTEQVCVMFLDIRDFTAFAEHRSANEVYGYLNDVFGYMIDVVNEHGGIINKFLGDGFMAAFGTPVADANACANAVAAARAICARLDDECMLKGLAAPRIGISLHYGPVVVGTIGSSTRREFTIIGDTVNVAARIESLNKRYGTSVLMSESVRIAAGLAPNVVGDADLVGHDAPVTVHAVV